MHLLGSCGSPGYELTGQLLIGVAPPCRCSLAWHYPADSITRTRPCWPSPFLILP